MEMTGTRTSAQRITQALGRQNIARMPVLIVEDNDPARRMVTEVLRGAGFGVIHWARSAEEALERMTAQNPALILLDWGLPGLSGLELARRIRQAAVQPDPQVPDARVPLIMLTGRQKTSEVTQARNAGVDEFVVKPFSTVSLLRAVNAGLNERRDFVVSAGYVGPCRRRQKAAGFSGPYKRVMDIEQTADARMGQLFAESLSLEMEAVRTLMEARGGLDRTTLDYMVDRLTQAEQRAHKIRHKLLEQVTHSLNEYVRQWGTDADPNVLNAHLSALIRLKDVPPEQADQASAIVRSLGNLVAKRKHRKLRA